MHISLNPQKNHRTKHHNKTPSPVSHFFGLFQQTYQNSTQKMRKKIRKIVLLPMYSQQEPEEST